MLAEHQWIIVQYPEAAQIDVWGEDPLAVAASSLAPREAARRVPGRLAAGGHYPFSSGYDFTQWAIIGAFLGTKGDPRGVAYLLVPLAETEIVDDWQVLGLLGTGSKSLVLHDVFVPEHWSATSSPAPRRVRWSTPTIRYCARRAGFWCLIHCRRSPSRSAAAPSTSPVRRSPPGSRVG